MSSLWPRDSSSVLFSRKHTPHPAAPRAPQTPTSQNGPGLHTNCGHPFSPEHSACPPRESLGLSHCPRQTRSKSPTQAKASKRLLLAQSGVFPEPTSVRCVWAVLLHSCRILRLGAGPSCFCPSSAEHSGSSHFLAFVNDAAVNTCPRFCGGAQVLHSFWHMCYILRLKCTTKTMEKLTGADMGHLLWSAKLNMAALSARAGP